MHSIRIVIAIILVACFLPYIFAFIARQASGYQHREHGSIRHHLSQETGFAARAHAVSQNSFEGLPLFLVSILMADYLVVSDYAQISLGVAYLICRILYGICYLADWDRLRAVMWLLATACPVLLLVLCFRS